MVRNPATFSYTMFIVGTSVFHTFTRESHFSLRWREDSVEGGHRVSVPNARIATFTRESGLGV